MEAVECNYLLSETIEQAQFLKYLTDPIPT